MAEDLKERISILGTVLDVTDDVYQNELHGIQYKINGRSKIQIESKDDYKSRTGYSSPDFSDSLALANYGRYIKGAVFDYRKLKTPTKKTFSVTNERGDPMKKSLKRFKVNF